MAALNGKSKTVLLAMERANPGCIDAIKNGMCPMCHKPVTKASFRDASSMNEFKISGMCQACQDGIFGDGKEEDDG